MIDDVRAAQTGDRAAFRRLVTRYRGMALGYAAGWVGDDAEDVVQDAFVNAFLRLSQLEDAAAFPGWLRRIVHKHCDRRTRRKPPPALEADEASSAPNPGGLVDAVDRLPAHERIVAALHYLGDEPQKDVAAFLELPLSTVKKRLHTARRRLAKWRPPMKTTARPVLEDRVMLFLAIRRGDAPTVAAILDRCPAAIDEREGYADEEAFAADLPLAHRQTPLLLAAGLGDEKLVALLLDRGADVDGKCGCEANETPLFAAASRNRDGVVRQLLARGADPTLANAAGYRPIDVAQLRGHDAVVAALAPHGAPVARREDTPRGARRASDRIVTGIKAIDLLAPLERGMLVRVHGPAETGLTVLLAELSARFAEMGGHAVWTSGASKRWQGGVLDQMVADLGVTRATTVATEGALSIVDELCGRFDFVALFVFLGEARESEVDAALPAFTRSAAMTFVIDPWVDVTRGDRSAPTLTPPWDAVLCLNRALADEGIYPALDPKTTTSRASVSERHDALRAEVRRRAEEHDVRARLGQPFEVVQHETGIPAKAWTLEETLDEFDDVIGIESRKGTESGTLDR